ncbi:MAG: PEP-CTERM sorting domain-containing protein [Alphaproteobacteria bacterium]|nr:PEP-CTERM sorting domain-containing protein [Alphaproteobacteria bacterium]MBN9577636.1 PEP-CTERM sorting domain-containing protein [Alphaproteobacteria bacterium]
MFHKLICTAAALAALTLAVPAANASTITAGTWYTFGFDGPGGALYNCPACTIGSNAPDGAPIVFASDAPWTITTTSSSQQLIVLDGFLSTDQFQIFDNLVDLGPTSAAIPGADCGSDISCAYSDASFSRGIYALNPGAHSFTGTQIAGAGGAGFFMVTEASATPAPEPATLALFGAGLFGAGFLTRRRKAS